MNSSIEALSQAVSDDLPSGENLEYDPQFQEMESLLQPKDGPAIQTDGEEGVPVVPLSDWKKVGKLCSALLENTRDLRIQVHAAIASIHTQGLLEFRDNLNLLNIWLADFWDSVHPQLDPEDNNDPTLRFNTLQMLNEHSLISMALDKVKLVDLKGVGPLGMHEVQLAQGNKTPGKGEEVLDINIIHQAFVKSAPEHLAALKLAVSDSLRLLSDIDGVYKAKTGDKVGLSFREAEKSLKKVSSVLEEFIPASSNSEQAEAESASGNTGSAPAISGAINNRADVIRVLDRICEYYAVHEPSSPIPMLLRRAQRLAEKSFMEILEDMVSDGVQQARLVGGVADDDA